MVRKADNQLVERRAGVALWRQIADHIRQEINLGAFDDSPMMPAEFVLAARYGVNRHTVRNALASLALEGLVQPMQGKGTMILRRDRLSYPISRRTRFSDGLQGQASRVEFIPVESGSIEANTAIADMLKLPPGTLCPTLETLGSADGIPLSRASHVFAGERFKDIGAHFSRFGSITRALAELGIKDYVRLATEVIARHALAEEVTELKLTPGAILLETMAVNGEPDGTPIQCSRTRFAADRIKLSIRTE